MDFNLYFKVIFSKFLQTYEETDNTMKARTIDTIMLGLNGNKRVAFDTIILILERFCNKDRKILRSIKYLRVLLVGKITSISFKSE